MNEIEQGKQTAWISYITIIGTIIAIFMNSENKNVFASFHIRQALGIFLTFFLLGYPVGFFDSWMITASFWTFIFILWLFGFMSALNGEQKPVPFLGEFYQNIFKNF
ncbi:hypothetical protein NAT47_06150 [Flavobacterium sp. HXWNR69]|uniref:Chloroplast import component protein (Tic20) n=1 Tax=Flavobacterium fragile TaxID=2949085 RepID=A0ABT0TGH3_9FLAO|nr:hypothetical protein [Flavobacterium sp. HXWNR69]MCL9769992.1 hypothetical protein [Flavobacterium sp. HXWNR69]